MKNTKNNFTKWDAAAFLDNEELTSLYLNDAFASGDIRLINKAMSNVVRARGMTKLANDIGVNRESLYKSLSQDGNPSFSTVLKIMDNLGLQLQPVPANDNHTHALKEA